MVVAIVSEERGGGGVPLVLCVRLRRIFPQLSQVEPPPPESRGKARSTYTSMLLQLISLDRATLSSHRNGLPRDVWVRRTASEIEVNTASWRQKMESLDNDNFPSTELPCLIGSTTWHQA